MPDTLLSPLEQSLYALLIQRTPNVFPWLEPLLQASAVTAKETTPYYSLLWLEPIPLPAETPIIDGVLLELRLHRQAGAPVQCLLHVREQKLHMFEVFCADSGPLPDLAVFHRLQIIPVPWQTPHL